tara:strand:+ start:49 stop:462 length:414 start_codon:yes stop_codon:yes gene_type:complete
MGRWDDVDVDFSTLEGLVVKEIKGNRGDDELVFVIDNDDEYVMYHEEDCCETVYVEDVCGYLSDIIGYPIINAYETTDRDYKPDTIYGDDWSYEESQTWTFYNISTIKGSVTIRWYGSSNGYYSESVSFKKVNKEGN